MGFHQVVLVVVGGSSGGKANDEEWHTTKVLAYIREQLEQREEARAEVERTGWNALRSAVQTRPKGVR